MNCSKEQYRELVNTVGVGILHVNNKGIITDANSEAERILGYSKDSLTGINVFTENWNALNTDKTPLPVTEYPVNIVLKTGKKVQRKIIGVFDKQKRQVIWTNVNAIPDYKAGSNELIGVFITLYEIKQEKQIIDTYRVNMERFNLAISASNPGLWDWNILTSEVTFNERWAAIIGYTLKELEPANLQTWINTCHPDDLKQSNKLLEDHFANKTEKYVCEVRMKHKAGHWIWVSDIGKVTQRDNNGKPLRMNGIHIDITHEKNTETALRESNIKYKNLFEQSPVGIIYCDNKGCVHEVNDAAIKNFGVTDSSIFKKYNFFKNISIPPEHIASLESRKTVRFTSEFSFNSVKKENLYNTNKLGKIQLSINISPLVIDPDIMGYIVYIQDITDMLEAGKKLKKQNKEYHKLNLQYVERNRELSESLEQIQSINKQLEEAKQNAEESDRLKSAFLANMSHEIRTPMNGIIGFADLLMQSQISEKQQQSCLGVIKRSGERLLNIINDLIDISKIESGNMPVKIEHTLINGILDNLLVFFTPQAKNKGISLQCEKKLKREDNLIRSDQTKLSRILSNLLSNAIKYTNSGSIKYGAVRGSDKINFYVKDTGIGIEPELLTKVFERFRQADLSTARIYDGAGLGLSISKAYVEMLGGTILVEAEVNKGSVFHFNIPVNEPSVSNKNTPVVNSKQSKLFVGHTILITEDDDVCYLYLNELLTSKGINTFYAKNGNEALEIIKSVPVIHLVLMDIKMPELNGYKTTGEIKKLKPEIPIIAQTAFASTKNKEEALASGCDDYISKPINSEILLSLLEKYLK